MRTGPKTGLPARFLEQSAREFAHETYSVAWPATFAPMKRSKQIRNQVVGEGNPTYCGHTVITEQVDNQGQLVRRLAMRPKGDAYSAQTKINAYNFPFTGNPAAGCFYRCVYCYLRQPFFQRHVSTDHGMEVNFVPDFPGATRRFLNSKRNLPQFMKRVQLGVSTEIFLPQVVKHTGIVEALREFRRAAEEDGNVWMVHLVTKSPEILKCADLLADMRDQIQVEVSFVTLDQAASRIFEQGTPSVTKRLGVVEELAKRDVFTRVMFMPVLREYRLARVGDVRHIVFENQITGECLPGRKIADSSLGNVGHSEVGFRVWRNGRWRSEPIEGWEPLVEKDWSNTAQAQAGWRNWGASAFKQKDLNYFHVDELLLAHREGRSPRPERGRMEDPDTELLIHSGESVVGADGAPEYVTLPGLHLPRKKWGGPVRPNVQRAKMDYGYRFHSNIDWIDCC